MKFKRRNVEALGSLIVGNVGRDDAENEDEAKYFPYRSSMYITEFFQELDTEYQHDGSTRHRWVADVVEELLAESHDGPTHPPEIFCRLIDQLMSPADRLNEGPDRPRALAQLNEVLGREGFEAFYGEDNHCYLRHVGTQAVTVLSANPHRPFSKVEMERREQLSTYLDSCSEDDLIEEVLLPLFRQLGFHRITAAGHKDKALEYGKDIWMRYTLPTQHILYFGIQAKKGKLDAAGVTKSGNANMAEIHHQALMMPPTRSSTPRRTAACSLITRSSWRVVRSPSRRATGSATRSTPPSAARSCSWTATTSSTSTWSPTCRYRRVPCLRRRRHRGPPLTSPRSDAQRVGGRLRQTGPQLW
ncbi:MAG: hypothetical protein V9G04_09970 [Nocardioides sp.]